MLPKPWCYFRPALLDRDAIDFLETRHSVLNFLKSRASQVPHPLLGGLPANFDRAAQGEDDAGNRFRDGQYLINTHAALVAVGTVLASLGHEDLKSLRN